MTTCFKYESYLIFIHLRVGPRVNVFTIFIENAKIFFNKWNITIFAKLARNFRSSFQDERIERVIDYVEHEILCAIDTEYYAYDENFRDQILSLTKEQGISLIHSKCWENSQTVLDKSDEEEMEYYSKFLEE